MVSSICPPSPLLRPCLSRPRCSIACAASYRRRRQPNQTLPALYLRASLLLRSRRRRSVRDRLQPSYTIASKSLCRHHPSPPLPSPFPCHAVARASFREPVQLAKAATTGPIARGVAGSCHGKDLGRRRVVAWTAALIRWRDAAPVPWCRNIPVQDIPAAVSSGAADANALFCPWRRATRGPGSSCDALPGVRGNRYASDSNVVTLDFLAFDTQVLAEAKEGTAKPTWGFDVCETLLFNKPCYAVDPSRWFHLSYEHRFSEGGMMVADVKEARLELLLESK